MEEKPKKKTTAVKATRTATKIRNIVRGMYAKALEANEKGQPVAYGMIGCQYDEILRAMDVVPIWTENYAGLCAAKRDAERFLSRAEADGYSSNLCGYLMTGIGFDAMRCDQGQIPEDAPDGGMAEPDMLLGCSATCDPRYKWYQALGHYMETPIYNNDIMYPPINANLEEVQDYYIKYLVEQFRGLVSFIEEITGRKMDWDRLSEILDISNQTWKVLWDCYQLRRKRPCPMPSQDHFSLMVPQRFMMGTQEALDIYKELYEEVKHRADNKMSRVPEEKYRLLWGGGLPPWHTLGIFNYFESKGAVFVMETAYRPFEPMEMLDIPEGVTDPLELISWIYFKRMTYRYEKARQGCGDAGVQLLLDLINDYEIDGMMMHQSATCRATTIGQIHYKNMVQEHVKIPTMFMESDIVDVRAYSEADTKMRVDALIENIEANRG